MNKSLLVVMALCFATPSLGAESTEDAKTLFGWFSSQPPIPEKTPPLSATKAEATKTPPTKARPVSGNDATVIASIDAYGYNTTYMELEADGKRFWIASSKLDIKTGNRVRFSTDKAVRLVNFTSKSLNRTFSSIYFVSEVAVIGAN